MKRALHLAGYAAWFALMFLVCVYLTFPLDNLKPQIVEAIETALGKGKQGQHGVDPKVTIASLSLGGIVGVSAKHVSIQLGSHDPEPGPTVDVEALSLGVRPWSLLFAARTIFVDADLYDGNIAGTVRVDPKGLMYAADLEADGLNLGKMAMLHAVAGLPVTGVLDAEIDLNLGANPDKDGEGDIKVSIKGATLGPGSPKAAAAFGGFSLPQIDLGNLTGDIPVKQGRGTLNNVKLDGKDLQVALDGDITFKGNVLNSRLNLDGWFFPTPALFEKDAKLKTLIDLGESLGGGGGPSLSKAKDDDGHYHFTIKGTAQMPSAALSRDGKKARAKISKDEAPPTAG